MGVGVEHIQLIAVVLPGNAGVVERVADAVGLGGVLAVAIAVRRDGERGGAITDGVILIVGVLPDAVKATGVFVAQLRLVTGIVVIQQVVMARFAAGSDSQAADESQHRSDAGLSGVRAIAVGSAAVVVTACLVEGAIAVLGVPVIAAECDCSRIGIGVLDLAESALRVAERIWRRDRVTVLILEIERIAVPQHDVVGTGATLE